MFRRSEPVPATVPAAPIDLSQPHDTCFRCGRPTPVGVSLCERDNPGHIKGPSTTQVHGTILIGVLAGFVLLMLLLRLAAAGVGPFSASLTGIASRADGGLDVVVQVSNGGTRPAGASCRIYAGGAPGFRDYVFFTELIPAGQSLSVQHTVPPAAGGQPPSSSSLAVRCN